MENIGINDRGAAVEDVQRRLAKLGFDLGEAGVDGIFSTKTAEAVREFRLNAGLPEGDFIDSLAWATLVDATFSLGDRILYLHMPYFHGNDVRSLQQILLALGFSCGPADAIFGARTEKAVREFQMNMGIDSDGIVGPATSKALLRLHHAWAGKDPVPDGVTFWGFSRAAVVLEQTPICFYGTDEKTRRMALAISNLALATTASSKVVSAQTLSGVPDPEMVFIELSTGKISYDSLIPLVVFSDFDSLVKRFATALSSLRASLRRIAIKVDMDNKALVPKEYSPADYSDGDDQALIQHFAVLILDAVCRAFSL